MSIVLRFIDNYLEFSNILISWEEEINQNPYNTRFEVKVKSGRFQGAGEFECDVKELVHFISQLRELYEFKVSEVSFQEIGYGCRIVFRMDTSGHITINGNVYDRGMSQELHYEFEADQTVLLPFIESIDRCINESIIE